MDPIVGWRSWLLRLGEPVLRSVAMDVAWPVGEITAVCKAGDPRQEQHASPAPGCRCGLYARTTLDGLDDEYPYYPIYGYFAFRSMPRSGGHMVLGAVLLWGAVLRGEKVVRAEHARVLCLTESPTLWAPKPGDHNPALVPEETRRARQSTIDGVCQAYSVPMIPHASAPAYAAEFGDRVA